ncbi:MAG: methyltransferase, partial [Candidatus Omnitrophota bacterium]
CRNPLYFFSFIGAMGMGFATGTIFFPFIMAAAFALYYPLVIKAEEHDLDEKYGKSFSNYLSTTPRFFPKIALFNEPDTYTVNPKIFRKDLIQAFGFIWTLGILKLIEELHNLDVLPALFKFY